MKTKRIEVLLIAGLLILMMLCLGTNVYAAAQNTTKTNITKIVEKAEGKVYVTWSKKSVDGYQIRWALNSKMTGTKTASFTETETYRSGLIGGKTYYFQVRTYKKINGKKVYSNWSPMKSIKLKMLPPTTTITSLKANSRSSFTVKWTKKSGVKGYQIRYSTDSSFKTKKTASTLKNIHTRKDLAKGTYYVSVRSYNVAADGTKYYSNWSGMKSVTLQAPANWKKAYKDFISKKTFLHYGQDYEAVDNYTGYLYDLDWDGIPELFICNEYVSLSPYRPFVFRICHAYTYFNSSIKYIGDCADNPSYDPSTSHSMLYSGGRNSNVQRWEKHGLSINLTSMDSPMIPRGNVQVPVYNVNVLIDSYKGNQF